MTALTDEAGDVEVRGTRVQRRRTRRVAAILTTTARALAETGYHNFNLEKVADELDLSKSSLYHYFPSKDELIAAAIEQIADQLNERLQGVADTADGRPSERLLLLIKDQLNILLRDYPEAAQLFVQPQDWPASYHDQLKKMRQQHDRIFRKVVEEGIAAGEFAPRSINVALHCLHGAINYATVWYRGEHSAAATDRTIDEIAQTVMLLFGGPAAAGKAR
jgi:AcrR family transcriptional regulator